MKTAGLGSPYYPTDYILQCMLVTIVYRLSHSAAQRGLATQTVIWGETRPHSLIDVFMDFKL